MSIYEYLWVKVTQNGSKWKIDSENATKLYLYMDIYLQKHDANPISIVNSWNRIEERTDTLAILGLLL
jgi:hypothetical protein